MKAIQLSIFQTYVSQYYSCIKVVLEVKASLIDQLKCQSMKIPLDAHISQWNNTNESYYEKHDRNGHLTTTPVRANVYFFYGL